MEYITSLGRRCCNSLSPGNFVCFCWDCSVIHGALQHPRKKSFQRHCSPFWPTMIACLPLWLLVALYLTWISFPFCYFKLIFLKKKNIYIYIYTHTHTHIYMYVYVYVYIYIGWLSCTSATKRERKKRARLRNREFSVAVFISIISEPFTYGQAHLSALSAFFTF